MIIQFTIGNFLSFKEQSTLSLAASALKEIQVPAEDIIFSVGTARIIVNEECGCLRCQCIR